MLRKTRTLRVKDSLLSITLSPSRAIVTNTDSNIPSSGRIRAVDQWVVAMDYHQTLSEAEEGLDRQVSSVSSLLQARKQTTALEVFAMSFVC